MYKASDLRRDLIAMNLHPSDTLLVHSSMKSIGEVENGADTVLDVFMEYFGKDGLLVFPTLTYSRVNTATPRYDVVNTPCSTGILPELFRQRKGVIRSLHPTHSVAAYGRDAAAFVAGHEKFDTPAAVGSPWWRMLERQGKILFIGTGISCNTFLHGMDEWLELPGMSTETTQLLEVIDYNGNVISSPQHRHCNPRNAYYGTLEDMFTANGALSKGRLSNAQCHILECKLIADAFNYHID